MAKTYIDEFENGGTLIYQKSPNINGYQIVIGFSGGAKLDGDIPGLSHLVEHLIFKGKDKKETNAFLNKLLNNSICQNAITSQDYIRVDYNVIKEHAEKVTSIFVDHILHPKASKEMIDNELNVISYEKTLMVDTPESIDARFLKTIALNFPDFYTNSRVLGDMKNLKKKVTPEVVKDYASKYFNRDNLIVCVLSNDPYAQVKEFCEKNIFSKFPNAKDSEYIVPLPEPTIYDSKNCSFIIPNPASSVVTVDFMLRERLFESTNLIFEKAVDEIECNIMTDMGGILWNRFRTQNQLGYALNMINDDLQTSKFKKFSIATNGAKANAVIKELCLMIKDMGQNGVDKKLFEDMRNAYIEAVETKNIIFKPLSAISQFQTYMDGYDFVDYDKVYKCIKNMTYDDFNNYIKSVYKQANASLIVSGDFDSRKIYNLIEIEEMMGKKANSDRKDDLNLVRVEATPMTLTQDEEIVWEQATPQIEVLRKIKDMKNNNLGDMKDLAYDDYEEEDE